MIVTEIIGQALEVSAPTFEILWPARREQLAVIPLVLHALAPFVQIFGIRGALRTGEIPASLAIAAFQPSFQESEALAFERPFACSPGQLAQLGQRLLDIRFERSALRRRFGPLDQALTHLLQCITREETALRLGQR